MPVTPGAYWSIGLPAILLVGLMTASPVTLAADRVYVIVNSANTQALSIEDIKNIYTDKVITWNNGSKIDIYNLAVDSPVRAVFSEQVLSMHSVEAAAAESNRAITNTVRNPQKTKSEKLLVSIVSKRPTAIGYASEEEIRGKTGIRIIATLAP